MSLFTSLNVSLSSLLTLTSQMQVISNNIANATTEGYTTKSITTTSVTLGNGGGGTQITGYTRAEDESLFNTLLTALSETGLRSTQNTYMSQLADVLGIDNTDDPALTAAMTNFETAWTALEASPEDTVCQQEVIDAATSLVSTIKSISSSLDSLDLQCSEDISSTLSDLNSALQNVADLNSKIASGYSSGSDVTSLEDQRDIYLKEIAGYLDITTMTRDDGQIAIYTDGGYCLLDGDAASFSYDGTTITNDDDSSRKSLNYVLIGGSLEALVSFRSTSSTASTDDGTNVIQKIRSQLDTIVSALTSTATSDTFASTYNGVASATITNGIVFSSQSSGTFGNGISVSIASTATVGTYDVTVHVDGQSDETYTVNSSGSGFWTNLATAINASSRLITASVSGTGAATVSTGTTTLSGGTGDATNGQATTTIYSNGIASTTVLNNCITYTALASGDSGNSISVTVSAGDDGTHYDVTVTDGTTQELYENVAYGGDAATFWSNVVNVINNGDGTTDASTLISATAGTGTTEPDDASVLDVPFALSGGDQGGDACLTLTALDAGTDGNNYTATISQGTTAGTYKVVIKSSGTVVETYDNISNTGNDLWQNIADAINASSTRIMATAGSATTLPSVTATTSKTYSLTGGSDELQTGFFTGTDVSTFAVNSSLVDGTASLKVSSVSSVNDALSNSSRSFTADGLNISNASYASLVANILTNFQSSATNISSLNDTAATQSEYLETRLTNETGVNIDTETLRLTTLQNAYAASANVIKVINEMLDDLMNIV